MSVIQSVSHLPISFELTTTLRRVLNNSPENVLPVCPISGTLLLVPPLPCTSLAMAFKKGVLNVKVLKTEDPLTNGCKDISIKLYLRKSVHECNDRYHIA